MKYLRSFVLAFQFMTRLPLPFNLKTDEKSFSKMIIFFPFVGAFVGIFSCAFYYLATLVNLKLASVLFCVIAGYAITGAFHLDGFADTADAFFARKSKERTLEILKDSRMGVYGVLAIVCAFALKFIFLYEISVNDSVYMFYTILLAPVASKIAVAVCACTQYARSEGISKNMLTNISFVHIALCCVISLCALYFAFNIMGIVLGAAMGTYGVLLSLWSKKRIGGITGDILGAAGEGGEIIFYFLILMI